MRDYTTLRKSDNDLNVFIVEDGNTIETVEQMFPIDEWDSPEAFKYAEIRGYEPMTAKELETDEEQDKCLNSIEYFVEEKFDGTRAIVQFFSQTEIDGSEKGYARVFSRRISKKTNFYVENSDSVPQIRDIDRPEIAGTVLDGEMFINGRPFKDVSSTLNCIWDKAIDRQIELGFISLHAFDIIKYKGIDLRKMPLHRRKKYLEMALEEIDSPYIELVPYFYCGSSINLPVKEVYKRFADAGKESDFFSMYSTKGIKTFNFSPREYYEMIVASGGEGVIVKPKDGLYYHKRGWEYSKIKKFLTREMIIMGFDEPTKEYSGKAPKDWPYVIDGVPVTKFYYNHQVGNLLLGVLVTKEEYESLKKEKRGIVHDPKTLGIQLDNLALMQVCECAGFDDETREYFTKNQKSLIGSVVEVKANEIMKDSGRLRHPRYIRMRPDKALEQCIWKDHIGG